MAIHALIGIWVAQHHPNFFYHNDGHEYEELATTLANSGQMSIAKTRYYEAPRDIIIPEAYRSPLLPLLGAIALKLIPAIPETCFAILQSTVFGLTLLMVYCIAFRLSPTSYKKLTGLCAATLFIFNPLLLQYSFQFSSEELFTLCLLFFISLSLLPTCWWQRLLLAASIVAATYTRPTALLLFPLLFTTDIYIIFQAWRKQQNSILKPRINASLITLMGAILFIAPWGIRNQILFDKFSPVTFLGGFNLLLGNSSENLAAYQSSNGKDFIHHQNTRLPQPTPAPPPYYYSHCSSLPISI